MSLRVQRPPGAKHGDASLQATLHRASSKGYLLAHTRHVHDARSASVPEAATRLEGPFISNVPGCSEANFRQSPIDSGPRLRNACCPRTLRPGRLDRQRYLLGAGGFQGGRLVLECQTFPREAITSLQRRLHPVSREWDQSADRITGIIHIFLNKHGLTIVLCPGSRQ